MRIAYIGHSYHRKTRSNVFFTDILCSMGTVDFFWDESWNNGAPVETESILQAGYDLIAIWQTENIVPAVASRHPNVVFVPMYDGARHFTDFYWKSLSGVRILAFCREVHTTALRNGLISELYRYFPEVPDSAGGLGSGRLKGFFWQRTREVGWNVIRRLIADASFTQFTFHDAPDPSKPYKRILPSRRECRKFGIRRTEWFPDRHDLDIELDSTDVYFAPRADEGIGMGFLEAMARGRLVVAPDRPTMNEYIVHGVTGLLYDLDHPRPLDFRHAATIGFAARISARIGRFYWLESIPKVIRFLKSSPSVVSSPDDAVGPCSCKICPSDSSIMKVPKVSFVIPSFNQGRFIARTLDSIASQGLDVDDFEVLVFDGGSTDNTVAVLKTHPLKTRWVSEKDGGQADAINRGLAAARGEIIAWINSDDVYEPGALRYVMQVFDSNQDVAVIYGRARLIDENDATIGEYPVLPWSYEALADSCFLCQPAVFFRRSAVNRYGPLDASLQYAMDYEYWLRIGRHTPFLFVDAILAASRIYADTKTLRDKPGVFREGLLVSKRHTGRWSLKWRRGLGYWSAKAACDQAGITSPVRVGFHVACSRLKLRYRLLCGFGV
jgi:glycosyltransferase involved in cell wall biosynthesis